MGIAADIGTKTVEFKNFTFDAGDSGFRSDVDPMTGVSAFLKTPLQLDTTFEDKKFHLCFLSKKGLRESEIFQVFDKSRAKRIGWCIPVNALNSAEHDYAENPHFLRYAYAGIKHALNSIGDGVFTKHLHFDEQISFCLSDVLPESTALFIVSEETLDSEFDIGMWLPAVASLGYFQLTTIDPGNISIETAKAVPVEVQLSPVSKTVENLDYLTSIYSYALPFEKKPVFRFFHLYQVLELMMELVFKQEHARLIRGLITSKDDLSTTREILEQANNNTSERRRLALLAQDYCRCAGESGDLTRACNNLLKLLGKQEGANVHTSLYPVRNFLFHQYRNFPQAAEPALEEVNSCFAAFLPILLGNFSYPDL